MDKAVDFVIHFKKTHKNGRADDDKQLPAMKVTKNWLVDSEVDEPDSDHEATRCMARVADTIDWITGGPPNQKCMQDQMSMNSPNNPLSGTAEPGLLNLWKSRNTIPAWLLSTGYTGDEGQG